MDYQCSICGVHGCYKNQKENLPKFCPMPENEELYKKAFEIVTSDKYKNFYTIASEIEKDGYRRWPRVKETIALIKRMNYKRVGLAFCKGLQNEARVLDKIFRRNKIELISAMCKTGGIDKENAGIPDEEKLRPGNFEAMCNPVAQALLLNKEKTELNIVFGLCVGHDSLFYKYSDALCTTLVVKDRVTGNNPCAAIYGADGYFSDRLDYNEK